MTDTFRFSPLAGGLRWRWLFSWVSGVAMACSVGPVSAAEAAPRLAMAVMGDSDSHGYHDRLSFPPGSAQRGGSFQASTHQWTEALALLRPAEIDLGPPTETGSRGSVARLQEWLGFEARSPAKFDHLRNFAVSGAGCEDLWSGNRQLPRLLRLMSDEGAAWRRGVVVIRIGVNSFGKAEELERLARDPADPGVRQKMDVCSAEIGRAVAALRSAHPGVRIVLVGVFDNSHWARYLDRWPRPEQQARIAQGLDAFDQSLKRLVASAPGQLAFFDDRNWFAGLWGGRSADGRPAYRPLSLGPGLTVSNTVGDAPKHATLTDGHAGSAWNAKWAQALVLLLNRSFQLGLTPISDEEVRRLVAPGGAWPKGR